MGPRPLQSWYPSTIFVRQSTFLYLLYCTNTCVEIGFALCITWSSNKNKKYFSKIYITSVSASCLHSDSTGFVDRA